jgi:glycosyltransferase involved in cell wall biosynthesis
MKICQLCAIDFTLKKFIIPLVDGMVDEGWSVYSVCSDGEFVPELRNQGYEIITIDIARSINPFKHIITISKLFKLFKKERFDVIHVHTPVASLVGRLAAWLAGIPLIIYTAHGFYFHDEMPSYKRKFFILLEKISGKITDFLFTQSSEDYETAIKTGIIKEEKVLAIGNGVDVERFNPNRYGEQKELKNSLGIPDKAFVVGMIGRLVKEKGVIEFLEAAEILNLDNPDIYFLLIGDRLVSDHAESVDKKLQSSKNKLRDNLILTGLRADIPELISLMSVFCLPSWREGMPRTIIEAMMMQKPVIATDIRGSREEVEINETGLLVPIRDTEKLSNAINKVKSNPEWASKLGLAGRSKAVNHYDESKIISIQIKKIDELYVQKSRI